MHDDNMGEDLIDVVTNITPEKVQSKKTNDLDSMPPKP